MNHIRFRHARRRHMDKYWNDLKEHKHMCTATDYEYDPKETFLDESDSEEVEEKVLESREITPDQLERFQVKKKKTKKKKKKKKEVMNKDHHQRLRKEEIKLRRAISSDPNVESRVVLKRSISHTNNTSDVVARAAFRSSRRLEVERCLRDLTLLYKDGNVGRERFEKLKTNLEYKSTRDAAVRIISDLMRHRLPFHRHPTFQYTLEEDEDDDEEQKEEEEEKEEKIDGDMQIETKNILLTYSSSSSPSEEEEEEEEEEENDEEEEHVQRLSTITMEVQTLGKLCDEVMFSTNTTPNLLYVKSRHFQVLFRIPKTYPSQKPLDMIVTSSMYETKIQDIECTNLVNFVRTLLKLHNKTDVVSPTHDQKDHRIEATIRPVHPSIEFGLSKLSVLPKYEFKKIQDVSDIANQKADEVIQAVVSMTTDMCSNNNVLRFCALQILRDTRWNLPQAKQRAIIQLPSVLKAYVFLSLSISYVFTLNMYTDTG